MPIEKEYVLRRARPGSDLVEVTIPSEWRKYHKLKIGDKIKLFANNIIVIIPDKGNKELEKKVREFLEEN